MGKQIRIFINKNIVPNLEWPFFIFGTFLFLKALYFYGLVLLGKVAPTAVDFESEFTSAIAILTIALFTRQLRKESEQKKASLSKDFIFRFIERDFIKDKFEALNCVKKNGDDDKVKAVKCDLSLHNKIYELAVFFEGMGIFYNENKLDRKIIQEFFIPASINVYRDFFFYVDQEKKKSKSNFANWRAMNSDFDSYIEEIRINSKIKVDGEE